MLCVFFFDKPVFSKKQKCRSSNNSKKLAPPQCREFSTEAHDHLLLVNGGHKLGCAMAVWYCLMYFQPCVFTPILRVQAQNPLPAWDDILLAALVERTGMSNKISHSYSNSFSKSELGTCEESFKFVLGKIIPNYAIICHHIVRSAINHD